MTKISGNELRAELSRRAFLSYSVAAGALGMFGALEQMAYAER